MLKHILRITLRTFRRYKSTFLINLIGLSGGLACALLIYLWVSDELGFDGFHENGSRLFQVMVNSKQGDGKIVTEDGTNGVLGDLLPKDIPEVDNAVSIAPPNWFQKFNITYGKNTFGAAGDFVGADYFDVFSYPLLEGNKNSALKGSRYSIVLSRTLATKLFGSARNIVGKTIEWKWISITRQCTVTGVFEDFPYNSTYRFDFVLPLDLWKDIVPPGKGNGPATGPFQTFVVLKEHTSPEAFGKKLSQEITARFDPSKDDFFIRKYSDAYLHGRYENGKQAGGRIEYVRLFSIIAVFILLIACINFMNLSTAKAAARMKEVGLKKALGASRPLLVTQFLAESVAMSLLSLVMALLLVSLFLPTFNQITEKHLTLGEIAGHLGSILSIAIATGLIASSYPAFYLSRFQPAITLKGRFAPLSGLQELLVRKGLVVFQFTLSVVFILGATVVYNQIQLVRKKNPGYDRENVIYFEKEGEVSKNMEPFLTGLRQVSGVVQASSIIQSIVLPAYTPAPGVTWEGRNSDDRIRFYKMFINYNLIETLGIKMAQGRSFSRDFGADSTGVILNEAAVQAMGLSNPVGKMIQLNGQDRRVIGVAKDFHFNSLHEQIRPFIFILDPANTFLVMARLAGGDRSGTIKNIRAYYRQFNPGFNLDYKYLEDDYKKQYAPEKLVGTLSKYFTGLAILLSCLGLFGLATFAVERRSNEIGIRKVLGASKSSIVYLLSADFTRIVLLSIVIGLPLSYWIISSWLDSFAYRTPLTAGYFIGAGLGVLFIAWLTIALQVIRSSLAPPLPALKEI